MLMFQYGFLTTFIPELLMVIGFAVCIISGIFSSNNYTPPADLVFDVAHVIQFEPQSHISAYQVTIADFQKLEVVPEKRQFVLPSVVISLNFTSDFRFSTSDGLTFVDFSRPPPSFIS